MKFQKGDIVVNKKSGEVYKVVQVFTATFDVMGKLGYCYGLPMKDFDLFDFTIGSLCSVRGKNCMFKEIHYMAQKAILIEEDSGEETQAPLEELRPPKKKEMKYKAGDKLRVLKNRHHHGFKIGETVRVIDCDGGDTTPYNCTDLKENEYWWLSDEEVELFENPAPTLKYKVGDKIQVIRNHYKHEFPIGDVVEVVFIDSDTEDTPYKCKGPDGDAWWLGEDEVQPFERATEKFSIGDYVYIKGKSKLYQIGELNYLNTFADLNGPNRGVEYDIDVSDLEPWDFEIGGPVAIKGIMGTYRIVSVDIPNQTFNYTSPSIPSGEIRAKIADMEIAGSAPTLNRRPEFDPYKDNYIAGVPDHIDGGFDMKVEWKPIKPSPPRLSIKPKKNHRPGLEVKKFNTEKIKLKS